MNFKTDMNLFRTYRILILTLTLTAFLGFSLNVVGGRLDRTDHDAKCELKSYKSGLFSSVLLSSVNERVHPLQSPHLTKVCITARLWDPENGIPESLIDSHNATCCSLNTGLMILHWTCRMQV